jgi:hypothetical protein
MEAVGGSPKRAYPVTRFQCAVRDQLAESAESCLALASRRIRVGHKRTSGKAESPPQDKAWSLPRYFQRIAANLLRDGCVA